MEIIQTYKAGLVLNCVNNGEHVVGGQTLCTIHDLTLKKLIDIKATCDGVVITNPSNHFADRGQTLFIVQPK